MLALWGKTGYGDTYFLKTIKNCPEELFKWVTHYKKTWRYVEVRDAGMVR